jgi:hypothetical protein
MHELFANWYSQVSPQLDSKRLEDRSKAVDAYVSSLKPKKAPECALLALALGDSATATDEIRQAAKRVDTTYVSTNDALELNVLAAAAIAQGLKSSSVESDALALSFLCAAFNRKPSLQMHADLHKLCAEYLIKKGTRVRDDGITFPSFNMKSTFEAIKKQADATDFPTAKTQLHEALNHLLKLFSEYSENSSNAFARLRSIQREDSDIAFVVVSGYSFITSQPFAHMKRAGAALIAAHELTSVTRILPSIVAYDAVLSALLKNSKGKKETITIREAVNDLPVDIQRRFIPQFAVAPQIMPCHFALQKAVEVDGQDVWDSAFKNSTGLNPDHEIPALELARQGYFETMLSKALAG